MTTLKGSAELKARLRAIKVSFKPIGRRWAQATVAEMRPQAPDRTGKGKASIRVKNASMTKATVSAVYYMGILDKGNKAYPIAPRKAKRLVFKVGGQTVFAKKANIPARRGLHFAERAAHEALRQNPMAGELIDAWNRAA